MNSKLLASFLTLFIVFVLVFAVYLQKYNPEIYMGVLLFILTWIIVGFMWMMVYVGIDRYKNKK